jgi:3-phenylpropionate/trans-cinnamate dioxygenase ferredoxin reductase subunit
MLGLQEPFEAVPFFWSRHYDVSIDYVGHAERWDSVRVDGSLDQRDAQVTFLDHDRALAVATIGRARQSLQAEVTLEGLKVEGDRHA